MDSGRRTTLRTLAGVAAALAMKRAAPRGAKQGMRARPIPASGELLPVIGLGTWQVFDAGADAAARAPLREVLAAFAKGGGRLIDTSPMYGSAEAVVGELAAELGIAKNLFLATKVWTSGSEDGVRQMEASFARLRVKRMDLMQVHNLKDVAVHASTLAEWKQAGRLRYTGITHYSPYAYPEIERLLAGGQYDFLQINYSLAERESAQRLLPLAQERRIAVIANRPFADGALFQRVRGKLLPAWAGEIGAASWAQFFLKWILGHPAVTCAIPGTGRPDHMADNLAAGFGALPDEPMRRRMAAHLDSL
jgi:diketogulonate reductase-like aldo/keto reductase